MRLDEIIKQLKETIKINSLNVTDDCLFTNACSFLRGEYANQKFSNTKKSEKPVKKASDKQLAYIQQLADKKKIDIRINPEMTSLEATKLIEDLKK